MDEIQKTKKAYVIKAKEIKGEVMEAAANLKAANDMKRSLLQAEVKKEDSSRDLILMEDELMKIDNRIQLCESIQKKWDDRVMCPSIV